jgi:uncharacterized protein (TIGR03083 family)
MTEHDEGGRSMHTHHTGTAVLPADPPDTDHRGVADECRALAGLLEAAPAAVWDAPSLCEGWRTREVVAHMTMPVRYPGPAFLAELEAAGGDFTRLSDTVAARDALRPTAALLADLRADALHAWEPPGGGSGGALTHCVVHALDIVEAVPLGRHMPSGRIARVLELLAVPDTAPVFDVDLDGVALEADDLDWSLGGGATVRGPAQALVLVVAGRTLPAGRLSGDGAGRFSR